MDGSVEHCPVLALNGVVLHQLEQRSEVLVEGLARVPDRECATDQGNRDCACAGCDCLNYPRHRYDGTPECTDYRGERQAFG